METRDTNPIIIRLIKEYSHVLELGAANGRMTKYLKQEKKCIIDIVEIDENSGREAAIFSESYCIGNIEGNIENYVWCDKFKNKKYDFIIFADVLEHLHEPQIVLNVVREFLAPQGVILVSIPNVAHNAVIANLMDNRFKYQATGLLDTGHIHFFTRDEFENMTKEIGLESVLVDKLHKEINQTELSIKLNAIEGSRRKVLYKHVDGNVYQYIYAVGEHSNVLDTYKERNFFQNCFNKFYFAKIYWTTLEEQEFCEKNSQICWVYPEAYISKFIFQKRMKIQNLRIDPLNCNLQIKIHKLYLLEDGYEQQVDFLTNATYRNGDMFIFMHNNPQILIENINVQIRGVELHAEILVYDEDNIKEKKNIFQIFEREYLKEKSNFRMKNEDLEKKLREINLENEEHMHDCERLKKEVLALKMTITKREECCKKLEDELKEQIDRFQIMEMQNLKLMEFYIYITNSKIWKLINRFKKGPEL